MSSLNTTQNTCRQRCVSLTLHLISLTRSLHMDSHFVYFFLLNHKMSDMQVYFFFVFGTQRQESRSTTVDKVFEHVWTSSAFRSLPASLSLLLTKTNFLYIITSSCTFVYSYLQPNVVVHMHIYCGCINGFSVHVISLYTYSST